MDAPSDSYAALRKESRAILHRQWCSLAPPPPGYPYPPSLAPHPFMGLPKLMAGRFHQMRSGKSYLAAHPSWFNRDTPSLCPRCRASAETFEHAILHCKARRRLKESLLLTLTSLDAASPYGPPITMSPFFLDLSHSRLPVSRPTCSPRALLPVLPTALFPPLPSPPRPVSGFLLCRMFDLLWGFFTLLF